MSDWHYTVQSPIQGMKTTNIISTLICICILFIHNTLSTSTGPHRLPSHKRFVKTSHKGSSRLGKVPQDVKAFKRYVIHPHSGSAARLNASPGDFRRKRNTGQGTTFSHSDHQVKLKRTADSSLNVLNKRDTHPLIHWTQHYNQALGRGARTVVNNNRQKRNVVAKEHLRESEERLAKRWQTVPGAENMGKLKLRKRKNILVRARMHSHHQKDTEMSVVWPDPGFKHVWRASTSYQPSADQSW